MRPAPITNIKSDNLHTQVYKQLKVLLLEGHWEVGERLPSEAELCRLFGVSRISVRTALKSLIAQGVLVSRQGEGTFVVDVSLDMNMDILVPIIGLDERNILEVLENLATRAGSRQKAEEYLEKHFRLTMNNIKHAVVNQ